MEEIHVDTSPTKEVMVQSLIRDVSVDACVCDLIDNSIDAARELIQKERPDDIDEHGLPKSYEGYKIKLNIDRTGLFIRDNCGGMGEDKIIDSVLRFGKPSRQTYGIGLYGVGLNRAIFKLCNDVKISSTTDSDHVSLEFSVSDFIKSKSWELKAFKTSPVDQNGTIIRLENPTKEAHKIFSSTDSIKDIEEKISRIYYSFIQKGFEIEFNNDRVESKFVELRDDSPFPLMSRTIFFDEDIRIDITAGQHIDHKFSAEPSYKDGCNDSLTPEYGWTVICNDRPVVICNRESITGWNGKFHSQFYGFVGYVQFYSKDGHVLPWNTSKTGVDLPNPVYQKALTEMLKFTKKWRSYSDIAKKHKRNKQPLLPASSQEVPIIPPEKDEEKSPIVNPEPPHAPKPKKIWSILPDDVDDSKCSDKVRDVVYEAKRINLRNSRYSAMALMRMLFELASLDYLIYKKKLRDLKDGITKRINEDRINNGKPELKKSEGRLRNPKLEDITDYFIKNPEIWGGDKDSYMRGSLNSFVHRKEALNSALHDPVRKVAIDKIEGIRDELLPILRHLIEHRD